METRASIKVRRSEFIAILFPVVGESGFSDRLQELRKEFHDAAHHCWAWRIGGAGGVDVRSSDDGEPSGTAGRPILQVLESEDLSDVGLVVVRYFGGIKLGTGGLARAYREVARTVFELADTTTVLWYTRFEIRAPYEDMNTIYRLVSPPDVVLEEERFDETTTFVLSVRRGLKSQIERSLKERRYEYICQD